MQLAEIEELADAVRAGDRRALARAITLVESRRPDHRTQADALLAALLPHTGAAMRVGITGAPGVGKSTFIEALGCHLIAAGERVAVLAIDPSSQRSGGAILGDKTRMEDLARAPGAYIRPSPAGGTLGGIAARTREAMLVCEAAGFGVILIETVGVGQSETAVVDIADMLILLLAPGAGDELQGLKRGIVELADLIVVNKADGAFADSARALAADYRLALGLLAPRHAAWRPEVVLCAARERVGIAAAWQEVERFRGVLGRAGELAQKRAEQARAWLWRALAESVIERVRESPETAALIAALEPEVAAGRLAPSAAVHRILNALGGGRPETVADASS